MPAGINRKIKKFFGKAAGSWRRKTNRPLIATCKGKVEKFTKSDWNSIFVEGYGDYANDENKLLSGKGKNTWAKTQRHQRGSTRASLVV